MKKPVRVMRNKVRDDVDFGKLLEAIGSDLAQARDHYVLFKRLGAEYRRYWRAFAQAPTFWHLTYRAQQDAFMFRLCRAYDQNLDALTLRTFLETVKSRPEFFGDAAFRARKKDSPYLESLASSRQKPRPGQLTTDIKAVSQEHNSKVRSLMMWRHHFYAHRDAGKILDGRVLAIDHPLSHDDIERLIERGFRIINRYSYVFAASINARNMLGSDDVLRILEPLHSSAQAEDERLRREVARVRRATNRPANQR